MNTWPLLAKRLQLRPFREADLPVFTAYRADPAIACYQSWSDYDQARAAQFWAGQQDLVFDTDGSWFQLAIERIADGVLLGDIAVHFFDAGRQVELGVTLATAWQGQGYAREALTAVLEMLFRQLGKHRTVATVDRRNAAVQRLLLGLGFRCEATYRQNVFFKGAWSDECSYAMLASEWGPPPTAVTSAGDHEAASC